MTEIPLTAVKSKLIFSIIYIPLKMRKVLSYDNQQNFRIQSAESLIDLDFGNTGTDIDE